MIQILMQFFQRVHSHQIRKKLGVVLFFVAIFAYATTGFMYFELDANPELNWSDAAWWAVVTMTTVGYGDYFPTTDMGRLLVGLPTMLLGVSMLGYMLSLLASAILESKLKEQRGGATMNLDRHVIICHYNSEDSTLQLVLELRGDAMTANSPIVLIDDKLEELPESLRLQQVSFVRGNPAREATLEQASFRTCRHFLLQADEHDLENSDARNLTVALTVERLAPEVVTVVHCVNPDNTQFFERAGVDSVICPSTLSNQMMVQELQDPGMHSILAELTSNTHGKQFYVVKPPSELRTVGDLREYYHRQGAVLMGIRGATENEFLPDDARELSDAESAIVVGSGRPDT
ncbi:MAG: ion channel [Planctomycetota bacterium]|nr:ion channel [Planctomycetota bacterium]